MEQPIKSQRTRQRIAEAARRVFAAQGYERATIRMIADEAQIHASMVMRYFGSKEALFATVVQFELHLPDLAGIPPSERGRALVAHFLDRWDNAGEDLVALLRAAITIPAARTRMEQIFEGQLVDALGLIGDHADAGQRAALVASQMLGLALTRNVLGFKTANTIERQIIVDHVGATIQLYLHPV